jgi:flagellar biosynthetic protein FliR
MISFVFYAVQMAGSLVDIQIGLGSSQVINPSTGVPITIASQLKFMLAMAVFLAMNGHHAMFVAFAKSYEAFPTFSMDTMSALQENLTRLLTDMSLLALQIAAPVAAVGLIVDAGLGIINKAVPQMPVFLVGIPAKVLIGVLALSISLPTIVGAVDAGVHHGLNTVWQVYQGNPGVR